MMNHNCEPNIVMIFNSTQVEVRANRNIKAGEELQHCYKDIAYDCTFRSRRITDKYQFECHCTFSAFNKKQKTLMLTFASGDRCVREIDRHYKGASPDINNPIVHIITTQGDLFELVERANHQAVGIGNSFDVSALIAEITSMTEKGYAGRQWPNDLEPLPIALRSLATICLGQGDIINALRIQIRALAYVKNRNTLPHAEDLIEFVVSLRSFTMYPHRKVAWDGPLPKFKDFEDFCVGHMCALHALLTRFYGEQGRVTRIIRDVMHEEIEKYRGPRPPSRVFRRKFKSSHETILKWAGVDPKYWVVELS